mgnify:CR=1 FL=1
MGAAMARLSSSAQFATLVPVHSPPPSPPPPEPIAPEILMLAYRSGIFPWFNEDEPPLWWCPDPRCVIFPDELYISKSMQQLLKRNAFEFSINNSFSGFSKSQNHIPSSNSFSAKLNAKPSCRSRFSNSLCK